MESKNCAPRFAPVWNLSRTLQTSPALGLACTAACRLPFSSHPMSTSVAVRAAWKYLEDGTKARLTRRNPPGLNIFSFLTERSRPAPRL